MSPKLKAAYIYAVKQMCARQVDELDEKRQRVENIKKYAEYGKIAIVTGGMDCDGSAWEGATRLVSANYMVVNKWLEDFYNDAEGPQHHRFMRPSDAKGIEVTRRDLAMEAHENGHGHCIHY